jgi:hypothetical protein
VPAQSAGQNHGHDDVSATDEQRNTTGMKEDAEGRHLRRRPKVGAVGVGRLQNSV